MQEFRFTDADGSTDYDYLADEVAVQRGNADAKVMDTLDLSRELDFVSSAITVEISGVWEATSGHSLSGEDLWQLAIERSLSGTNLEFYPDLDDTTVSFKVLPVPGAGPAFYRTETSEKRLTRSVRFTSDAKYEHTAAIWDDLKSLTDVL